MNRKAERENSQVWPLHAPLPLYFMSAWLKCELFSKKLLCLRNKSVHQNKSMPEATLTHPGISHQHTNRHLQARCYPIICMRAVCLPLTHTPSHPHGYTDATRTAAFSIRPPFGPVISARHLKTQQIH